MWFNFKSWGEIQNVPAKFQANHNSWIQTNPNWELQLWNETTADGLLKTCPKLWRQKFYQFNEPIQRADFFRWVVLFMHGGCYCDMDSRALLPLDLFLKHTLPKQKEKHLVLLPDDFWAMNAIIIASQGNPMIQKVLDTMAPSSVVWNKSMLNIFWTTGPAFVSKTLTADEEAKNTTKIIRSRAMCFKHINEIQKPFPKAILATHDSVGTWGFNAYLLCDLLRLVVFVFFLVGLWALFRPPPPLLSSPIGAKMRDDH